MKEYAVTLPLDIAESIIATCDRFMPGNLKPKDREALRIAKAEVEHVRALADAGVGQIGPR